MRLPSFLNMVAGSSINIDAIQLSQTLRKYAHKKGVAADDTYQNVNGIKMQLANALYLIALMSTVQQHTWRSDSSE